MVDIRLERSARKPFPRWAPLTAILASLAAFAVVLSGQSLSLLQWIEQGHTDIRTSLFSDRLAGDHPDIVLISVGDNVDATRATFAGKVELDRARLARLIEIVDEAAPRAIGIDVAFGGPTDQIKDQVLQRVAREAKARVVFGVRDEPAGGNPERRAWADRYVAGTGRAVGHIATLYEGNRVMRFDSGALALSRTPDSFATLMARALRPEVRRNFGNIAWLQKVDNSGWFTRWFNFGGQPPFRLLYGEEIVDNVKALPPRALSGRLVLISSGYAEVERHRTPLTAWSGEAVPAINIQAQAIAQLLDGRSVGEIPPRNSRMMLFTLAALAGLVGWYRRAGLNAAGLLFALFALIVADVLAYNVLGIVLPAIQAIAVWFLGETAGRALRRILRWEEANGHPWPIEERSVGDVIDLGAARRENA